jgi:methylmalonyl-CoA/ethylmalonyl-CoA epimerase
MEVSMVIKIDHIGVLTKDLEAAVKKYESLLGLELDKIEEVKVEDAMNRIAFLPVKETKIELIQTTANNGMVADFIREHGEAIHHIAFRVDDLQVVFDQLRSRGVHFLWDSVIAGAQGSKVAFFKPEEFNGIYIELVEKH